MVHSLLLILLLITGCNPTTTLFRSNFDATPVDQPPAPAQSIGTVAVEGGVRVAVIPGTNVKGAKFGRIGGANTALLRCNLAQTPGDGVYVFSTALYFPTGSGGLVTIAFENSAGQRFLHLDFPFVSATTGHVRIDDDESTVFGETKRDQLFIVQVTLNISAAGATAKVVLSGAGSRVKQAATSLRRLFQSRDSLAESAYRRAYRRTIQRFLPPTSSLREQIRDNVRLPCRLSSGGQSSVV